MVNMSLKTWFIATRPWSLVMTFVSTCFAGILAYGKESFSLLHFFLVMVGLLIAHIAANMANDWYDVKHGVDENAPTAQNRPHPLLFEEVNQSTYKMVVFSLYLIGFIIGLYFTWLRGLPIMAFIVLGALFGIFYTADPILLKHRSYGEISVFLAFGPLMVGGAYYALTGIFSWSPMIASTPIGLLVALVLLANNIRDKDFDASVGISTITTNKDIYQVVLYYKVLLASTYIVTVILIINGTLSVFSLITFLTIKEAMEILKTFKQGVPLNSDQITAQLALHYGILIAVGELINILLTT